MSGSNYACAPRARERWLAVTIKKEPRSHFRHECDAIPSALNALMPRRKGCELSRANRLFVAIRANSTLVEETFAVSGHSRAHSDVSERAFRYDTCPPWGVTEGNRERSERTSFISERALSSECMSPRMTGARTRLDEQEVNRLRQQAGKPTNEHPFRGAKVRRVRMGSQTK